MSITILLADDHEVIRYGMSLVLSGQDDLEIVGEAGSGEQVLDLAEKLHPDLVLLDMGMPGISAGSLIAQLLKQYPVMRVLVLSMHTDQALVLDALRSGACGYVLKENSTDEILRAVREVAAGRKYVTPKLAGVLVDGVLSGGGQGPRSRLAELTAREQDVIRKAADGLTSTQIAKELFISIKTVETHVSSVLRKLQLSNRHQLTRWATDRRLV